jgi:transcriptional regulator with XRE-family HTH domain
MSTSPETLGQRLQRLRVAAGLTQAQVAEAAGVLVNTLRSWEIDRREPGLRPACRLARVLGVTAEYLAESVPVEEAGGKKPRPAGPSRRLPAEVEKPKGTRGRKRPRP